MKPDRFPADDPREWIRRARSNLAHALATSPGVCFEDLCFDAQQTAEKAIKAVFIQRGESFPYIHELEKLLKRLQRNGQKIPKYVWDANELSPFAFETRYPGAEDSVTRGEYRRAVRIAAAVLRWAERCVDRHGP
jgi:HEPN domain-containing protein